MKPREDDDDGIEEELRLIDRLLAAIAYGFVALTAGVLAAAYCVTR